MLFRYLLITDKHQQHYLLCHLYKVRFMWFLKVKYLLNPLR